MTLREIFFPWGELRRARATIHQLRREEFRSLGIINDLRSELIGVRKVRDGLERQVDTLRSQVHETTKVNHTNAHAHRAAEVALLREQNANEELRMRLGDPNARPEAGPVPAMHMPKRIPVQEPKRLE